MLLALFIVYYPEFFSWFFMRIKTKYLKPEVSIFELLIIGVIVYLLVLVYSGE
jgi:hypothetical protein